MPVSIDQKPQAAEPVGSREQPGPILLLGMPRSGTTWLGKIFDSHPGTLYRHEPDSFGRLNFLPLVPEPAAADRFREPLRSYLAGVPYYRDTKVAATLPAFRKDYLGTLPAAWNAAARWGAKFWGHFRGEVRVPLWLPPGQLERARLVAKSIESLGRAGVLARALPEARLVILLRHPYGYLASLLRGKQGQAFDDNASVGQDRELLEILAASRTGQEFGLTADAIAAMLPVERLAWQWVLTNDQALADTRDRPNVTRVRYEDLCAAPFGETERLFRTCGLVPGPQTRRFLTRSTGTHRDRYYSIYKDPEQAAQAWRRELSAEIRQRVHPILAASRTAAWFPEEFPG